MANFGNAHQVYVTAGYVIPGLSESDYVLDQLAADFKIPYKLSAVNEGGYVNDGRDLGGETYRGISRVYNPKWIGWSLVDKIKKEKGGSIKKGFTSESLDNLAFLFYKQSFWSPILGDQIKSQQVANIVYDSTLSGLPRTIQMVKHILKTYYKKNIKLNSKMSQEDINALNSVSPVEFFNYFKAYRTLLFKYSAGDLPENHSLYSFFHKWNPTTTAHRKKQQWALPGWLNRVNKYVFDTAKEVVTTVGENKGKVIGPILFLAAAGALYYYRNPIKTQLQKLL